MRNIQRETKNRKKYKISRMLFIVAFTYFLSVFLIQQYKLNEYKVKENYYTTTIAEINSERAEYEALGEKTDSIEYIEKVARERLGLVKPYEKIFMDVNK